jgi:cytochrome c peroxidase
VRPRRHAVGRLGQRHIVVARFNSTAIKGKRLFESERLNCTACHSGFNFTNNKFENNGLYPKYQDIGRALITLDSSDTGKFRVPSLRNVAITSPYMHDGSIASLEAVVDHYEKTGNEPTPLQSEKLRAFTLTPGEKEALIAFLHALTDEKYLRDPQDSRVRDLLE